MLMDLGLARKFESGPTPTLPKRSRQEETGKNLTLLVVAGHDQDGKSEHETGSRRAELG